MTPKYYAGYRRRDKRQFWYVASVPAQGEDWGWTTRFCEAAELTDYWKRRFLSFARELNLEVGVIPVNED